MTEDRCRCGSATKPDVDGCGMLKCIASNAYVFNCPLPLAPENRSSVTKTSTGQVTLG